MPVAARRILIFYDQWRNVGQERQALGIEHFRALVRAVTADRDFGVISHSWGVLVLAGALAPATDATPPTADPTEGLLINPVSMKLESHKIIQRRQASSVSAWVRLKIFLLASNQRNGPRILKAIAAFIYGSRTPAATERSVSSQYQNLPGGQPHA